LEEFFMSDQYIALVIGSLVFLGSLISVEIGISVALIEITLGVIGGNFLKLTPTPWLTFLAGFGGILLTFLAGAEVDLVILREKAKESLFIGGISFLAPFVGAIAYCHWVAHWTLNASIIYVAKLGSSHAILPAFVAGLVLSKTFNENRLLQRKLRIIAFAMITPFFFVNGGINVSLEMLYKNFGLFAILFGVKQVTKIAGIYPFARRYVRREAMFTTLLMSTGLTMGTISSMYGFSSGIINQAQFSVLVAAVVVSAVLPTFIATKWFYPSHVMNGDNKRDPMTDEETGGGDV
jgi:Kef-type K+ transport system membrane component KefB